MITKYYSHNIFAFSNLTDYSLVTVICQRNVFLERIKLSGATARIVYW